MLTAFSLVLVGFIQMERENDTIQLKYSLWLNGINNFLQDISRFFPSKQRHKHNKT